MQTGDEDLVNTTYYCVEVHLQNISQLIVIYLMLCLSVCPRKKLSLDNCFLALRNMLATKQFSVLTVARLPTGREYLLVYKEILS